MDLMTSGAFARASGLSRKALRLYDELDLLRPVRVDPVNPQRLAIRVRNIVARISGREHAPHRTLE